MTGNRDERQQRARLSPFKRGQGFHPEGEWWVTAAEGSAESSSEAASESSGRCGDHLGTRAADARGWAARPVPRPWCPAGGDVASEKVQGVGPDPICIPEPQLAAMWTMRREGKPLPAARVCADSVIGAPFPRAFLFTGTLEQPPGLGYCP